MKLNNRFIFGILSLLLAAVIAFVALPTIARQTNGKEEIVRITQPVLKGEQISSENAEVVEVGGYNLPSNIAHQLSDVNGLYATADLAVGDYILTSKISSVPVSSDVALNSIPSGKVAISLTVKTLASGLSDKLQPGDIIRIYHFLDTAAEVPDCVLSKYCPSQTQTASMWIMPRSPRRMKKSSSQPPSLCWQALNRRRSLPVLKMTA
mgnify:FL=1